MKLPERFERIIRAAEERVLAASSDIKALVVIGSVAKGDWSEDSDVDIVCIVEGKLNREHRWQLMQSAPGRVQLVPFSAEELNRHFEDCTTMAHSIQRGIILFERNGFLEPYLHCPLGPPSKKWMKEWFVNWLEFYFMGLMDLERGRDFHRRFCEEECHCFISDTLARAAVNFSILYLESAGVIPVSKREIRKGMEGRVPEEIFGGVKMALQVCHEDRSMSHHEAEEVAKTASWLKEELTEELSVSQEDMARPLQVNELVKKARKEMSGPKEKPATKP